MPRLLPLAIAALAIAQTPARSAPPPAPAQDVVAALETALGDAIARAEPSVVAIARWKTENDETLAVRGRERGHTRLAGPNALMEQPFGVMDPFNMATVDTVSFDYGSGVVIGERGEILTAFHVVRGARSLEVRASGRQAFEAEILAADPRSDLAVIVPVERPGQPPPKLKPVKLGDSTRLRKGSFLVALGNPFNAARDGRPSASWGILSNLARKMEASPDDLARRDRLRNFPTLMQLDAKLNLGMSGGAVIDMRGELVGLTTGAANAAGFDAQAGYAIPMDALGRNVVETLRQGKEYEYGFLGISLDKEGSNRVGSSRPGTPAALGGVQVDDLVLAVGDIPVTDADSLVVAINSIPAGASVRLKLLRHDEQIERTVELAKLRVNGPVIATNRPKPWRGLRVDYASTLPSQTVGDDLLDAMAREGVVATEVEPGSASERTGLKVGQFISRVDGRPVRNPREFARAVAGHDGPVRLETDQGAVTVP